MDPFFRGRPSARARYRSPAHSGRGRLVLESLESRRLLSTVNNLDPTLAEISVRPSVEVAPLAASTPPSSAISPSRIASYYGFNLLASATGGQALDGAGQTIAIVVAYSSPTIRSDLHTFDQYYGLPDPTLTIVSQTGSTTALPAADNGWALESALDVQWAHAVAPKANILLVEASSGSLSDMLAAVQYASSHADIVSMSWGSSEFRNERQFDSYFNVPGVIFVSASGDSGGSSGAEWPSASPYVVSVGGTTLSGSSETAWSGTRTGSGGGVSLYEPLPSYQSANLGSIASGRATPDVAYVGNPSSGFVVYNTTAARGSAGWSVVGGTSAGAPQWAALFSLANQARGASNKLSSTSALNLLYQAAVTEGKSTPSTLYHDITSGNNARYRAGTGYDLVTGLGSPIAGNLVPYLTTGKLPSGVASSSVAPSTVSTTKSRTLVVKIWTWRFGFRALSEFTPDDSNSSSPTLSATSYFASPVSTSVSQGSTLAGSIINTATADAKTPAKSVQVYVIASLTTTPLGSAQGAARSSSANSSRLASKVTVSASQNPSDLSAPPQSARHEGESRLDANTPMHRIPEAGLLMTPDLIESPVLPDLPLPDDQATPAEGGPAAKSEAAFLVQTPERPDPAASTEANDQALATVAAVFAWGSWKIQTRRKRIALIAPVPSASRFVPNGPNW